MFTGLVEGMGEVVSFTRGVGAARLTIAARDDGGKKMVARLKTGDSVAVSGVCLTALGIEAQAFPPRFSADLAAETIARTTLSRLGPGSVVNLELPTPAGTPLGGHVVQGHVDGVGTLVALEPVTKGLADKDFAPTDSLSDTRTESQTDWVLRVRVPEGLMRYVVEKGSIAVEGISLTVAGVSRASNRSLETEDQVRIAILPHTYRATNLHTLRPGDGVNIEVDVLAKYAESRGREAVVRELTVGYLIANGY
jgi:riboflavin synthase